jgi:hypothetical protein
MARSSCLNNCTQALPGRGWRPRGWMCAGHRVNPLRNYATHSGQQDVVFGQSVPHREDQFSIRERTKTNLVIVTQHLRSIRQLIRSC